MSQSIDMQLILALAIVIFAMAAFGYVIYVKIAALGLRRDDFDRRAPWIALGAILGGIILYYAKH
jgi:hypothetical protein